jgi:hypothetical protein
LSTRPQVTRASGQYRVQYNRIVSSFGVIAAGGVYSFPLTGRIFCPDPGNKKTLPD